MASKTNFGTLGKHVPTPSFGGRNTEKGDRIDELIEDSEKALKGQPSKLSQQAGPDPKTLKDAFLETSPAFRAYSHKNPKPTERNNKRTSILIHAHQNVYASLFASLVVKANCDMS
jgi:hypothetical protein